MTIDKAKLDLDKPAFGPDRQKLEDVAETQTAAAVVAEPEAKKEEDKPEPQPEEQKVPYSRFKKFHDEATTLRQRETELLAEVDRLKAIKTDVGAEDGLPEYWKELFGDSDSSKTAYKAEQRRNEAILEQARSEATKAVERTRQEEEKQLSENEATIDSHLESVSAIAGHTLTDKEESAILDIIDEFTAKDTDGSYLGAILPADKAWQIYELKTKASHAPKIESRNQVASLIGNQSQGQPDTTEEKNKSWNPMDWNSYKNRL